MYIKYRWSLCILGENENSERVIMVNVVVGLVESSQKSSMPKHN